MFVERKGREYHMYQEKWEGRGVDGCGPWVCQWKGFMGVSHGPDVGKSRDRELICDHFGTFSIIQFIGAEGTQHPKARCYINTGLLGVYGKKLD